MPISSYISHRYSVTVKLRDLTRDRNMSSECWQRTWQDSENQVSHRSRSSPNPKLVSSLHVSIVSCVSSDTLSSVYLFKEHNNTVIYMKTMQYLFQSCDIRSHQMSLWCIVTVSESDYAAMMISTIKSTKYISKLNLRTKNAKLSPNVKGRGQISP